MICKSTSNSANIPQMSIAVAGQKYYQQNRFANVYCENWAFNGRSFTSLSIHMQLAKLWHWMNGTPLIVYGCCIWVLHGILPIHYLAKNSWKIKLTQREDLERKFVCTCEQALNYKAVVHSSLLVMELYIIPCEYTDIKVAVMGKQGGDWYNSITCVNTNELVTEAACKRINMGLMWMV